MSVIVGDCRKALGILPDNCVDAVVTDPPYGLSKHPDMREVLTHWLAGDDYAATGGGFMGQTWDSFVPGPKTWDQVYRVLKPGAYCAVFAGSRTVDLMATSLRLAGFEVVDMLHWLYGTGFPKSYDVSKAIDAHDAKALRLSRGYEFTAWVRENCPLSSREIDNVLQTNGMGRHYRDAPPGGKQPEVAVQKHFDALTPYFTAAPPERIRRLVAERTVESENSKRRPVVGTHASPAAASVWREAYSGGALPSSGVITRSFTPEAQKWSGWGTALKPNHEPIILCRKPLFGTYADNLLAYNCGALNIEACRVGERWPGNVLHDGCLPEPMDRYFYCAKATKKDRDEGLDALDEATAGEMAGGRAEGSAGLNSPRSGAGRTNGGRNVHPTVKPTEVMRWLCRLVTPPGGFVVDPFAGSGSTGKAAALEGFGFLGFELSEDYAEIARARIAHVTK